MRPRGILNAVYPLPRICAELRLHRTLIAPHLGWIGAMLNHLGSPWQTPMQVLASARGRSSYIDVHEFCVRSIVGHIMI